jgi:hypothetical protein
VTTQKEHDEQMERLKTLVLCLSKYEHLSNGEKVQKFYGDLDDEFLNAAYGVAWFSSRGDKEAVFTVLLAVACKAYERGLEEFAAK